MEIMLAINTPRVLSASVQKDEIELKEKFYAHTRETLVML